MATQTRYTRRSSGCRLLASGCLRTLGAFLPIASAIVETGSWISLAIREASSRPDLGLKRAGSALAKAGVADIQITSTHHDRVSFRYRKGIVKVILDRVGNPKVVGFSTRFQPDAKNRLFLFSTTYGYFRLPIGPCNSLKLRFYCHS